MRMLIGYLLCLVTMVSQAALPPHTAIQSFIENMVTQHNFNRQQLTTLMANIKLNQTIVQLVTAKSTTHLSWQQYRDRFITPPMIEQGKAFWQQYHSVIADAAKQYQVDQAIIVATLGVETRYGRNTGNFSVLQALYTRAFYVPRRAEFFQSELMAFLVMTREHHINPQYIKGSYAGAIGPAQFMPSSLIQYSHGKHLYHDEQPIPMAQAIRDAAHYYHKHGWQLGKPIAVQAIIAGVGYRDLPKQYFKSRMTLGKLQQYGITSSLTLPSNNSASLFILHTKGGPQYWLTLHNFYVITQYNKSLFYAMTVYQLAKALKASHTERLKT